MIKSFLYSVRYMLLIVIFYYIFNLKIIYSPSVLMIAIIPVNFLAIHYGILYKVQKDNYYSKYYILMSLIVYTTLFNVIFFSLTKTNFFIIVFTIAINVLELIYLDIPKKKKTIDDDSKLNNKKKTNTLKEKK